MSNSTSQKIHMVDTKGQYLKIKDQVDAAVLEVINSTMFIGGPVVKQFQENLEQYLGVNHVIPCANGTDALQIALMTLGLKPGDEVIVPAFTYVATAEVIALLNLKPIMVDVDPNSFNVDPEVLQSALTDRTKAIVPVHLYGQCADMAPIMGFATKHNLFVVEDNAQAIGATYTFPDGRKQKAGTIGHIGCTSFYPSKNLGAYGDGGAMMCNDEKLAKELRMVANHGQSVRYYHDLVGCNSRLDAIQAAILNIKLKHLDEYSLARNKAAEFYDKAFAENPHLQTPVRSKFSDHVFHQYTLRVTNGKRDELKTFLQEAGIPSMIYYPVPLYSQKAYQEHWSAGEKLAATEILSEQVLSLPIHTEMDETILAHISQTVNSFF